MKKFVPPTWLALMVLCVALLVPPATQTVGAVPADPAAPASATPLEGPLAIDELVGGAEGFFCALGLGMMIGGTASLQPEIVLAGSIIMGIGCGTGN